MGPRHVFAFVALLAGCRSEGITSTDPPMTLASVEAWSGGTLSLMANGLPFDSGLAVVVAGDTLPLMPLDSNTYLAGPLRDTSGVFDVMLQSGSRSIPLGTVRIRGFIRARPGPDLVGWPIRTIGSLVPTFIASGASGIVRVDLRFGTTQMLVPSASDPQCIPGFGVGSALEGFVTGGNVFYLGGPVSPPCTHLIARTFTALTDTFPGGSFPAAQLGPGHWVILGGTHQSYQLWQRQPGGGVAQVGADIACVEPAAALVFSPRGDRVIPPDCNGTTPVFDVPGFQLAYTIPSNGVGAAFTPGGDSLFIVGAGYPPQRLLLLDATDGHQMGAATIPSQPAKGILGGPDVMADPVLPWVYVVGWINGEGPNIGPVVWVYDRRTLALVAEMRAPSSVAAANPYWNGFALMPDPLEHRLYVIDVNGYFGNAPPSRTTIYEFEVGP
jgi:hypothetical protein